MKKLIILLFILFAVYNVQAQLTNTKWKGALRIDDSPEVIFDFGKDILKIYMYSNSATIENMTYTVTDSAFTLKKIEGQSDCDNEVLGKYKFGIKDNELSVKLLADDCSDRSSALNDTKWTKFEWPAEVEVDETVLKQYPGVYAMDDQHKITISFENGRLMADSQTNLVTKTALYATSNNKFLFHLGDISLEFIKGADGKVSKFIVHEAGKDYDWIKMK